MIDSSLKVWVWLRENHLEFYVIVVVVVVTVRTSCGSKRISFVCVRMSMND